MKQLLFLLLISATALGQTTTPEEITLTPICSFHNDSTQDNPLGEIHFDTIPGIIQVVVWEKAWGCLNCPGFQIFWIEGYQLNGWYRYPGSSHGRIMDKTIYLTSDKQPLDPKITVALFISATTAPSASSGLSRWR